ncbi:mycothiol synthase [Nocardioides yefusunii]|uniref:Mycothiol acetyltransferase n=1 Tax=Nocardioides yefusunii TaxID=2500546 RepID=A0ABW1QUE9_9ACTN|nr:mycothiol synthase [Nocardioides yefusunii]
MPTIDDIAARATAADGAAPWDESVTMALREGLADVVSKDGVVAVVVGDELALVADPPVRRNGLAADLAREVLSTHPDVARAWSHGNHPGAAALAASLGWSRVRDLWVMRRPMGEDAPDLPPLKVPAGVSLHRFGERHGDTNELLRVNAAAFAQHPEQGDMDLVNLARRMREDWFDPEGLIIATPTSKRGTWGFHWTKQHSPTLGEVYVVGVDPSAQGRGIGKLVTLAGLHHLQDAGVTEVLLYVEADNAAAIATYTSLGFSHADRDTHVMYARPDRDI